MSSYTHGPRLEIRLFDEETRNYSVLLDTAVDDVVEYQQLSLKSRMSVTVFDPDMKVLSRIASFSKNAMARTVLAQETLFERTDDFQQSLKDEEQRLLEELNGQGLSTTQRQETIAPKLAAFAEGRLNSVYRDTPLRVRYRMYVEGAGSIRPWKNGTIVKFNMMQDSSSAHLLKLFIVSSSDAPGTEVRQDGQSSGSKLVSDSVGTFLIEGRSSPQILYQLDKAKMVEAVEQLLANRVRRPSEGVECIVALGDRLVRSIEVEALRSRSAGIRTRQLPRTTQATYFTRTWGLTFTRNNGNVFLTTSEDDPRVFTGFEDPLPELRSFPEDVITVCQKLTDVAKDPDDEEAPSTQSYIARVYDEAEYIEAFGLPSTTRVVYVISTETNIAEFEQRQLRRQISPGGKRLYLAQTALAVLDRRIAEIKSETPISLYKDNKILLLRSGVADANVIDITVSNKMGEGDLGIFRNSLKLLAKRAAPEVYARLPLDLNRSADVRAQQWDMVWEDFYREQLTRLPFFQNIMEEMRAEGHDISEDEENALEGIVNDAVEQAEKVAGADYDGRDPGALAALLHFLREKQSRGGDMIKVKVPHSPEMASALICGTSIAYLQHVQPRSSQNLLAKGTAELVNIPPIGGFYKVVEITHTVSTSDAYTEIEMIRLGTVFKNQDTARPVSQDERNPVL